MLAQLHTKCIFHDFFCVFSGGFITALVVNPPERKLAKRNSVHRFKKVWTLTFWILPGGSSFLLLSLEELVNPLVSPSLDALKNREIVDWCKPKLCCKFWEIVVCWPIVGNLRGWPRQICGKFSLRSSTNAVTIRWLPFAMNSWVVRWLPWLNSLEPFFQKMTTFPTQNDVENRKSVVVP